MWDNRSAKTVFSSLPLSLHPSFSLCLSTFLLISYFFFLSLRKWFSCDIMVWITCAKITRLCSNNIVAKEEAAWSWYTSNCLKGLNSVTDDVGLHVSSSNHFCRLSENRHVWGSPLFWTQPLEVTVTGGEVAVQSNYTPDDGWVITRDWQEGYGVRLPCTAPWRRP